jgi:uncharacterized membrane protein
MAKSDKVIEEGKFFAVISYISFLCILSLTLKRENKFAVYHGKQGLVLFVAEVISFILSIIPLLGWLIAVLGSLIFTVASIWGIVQALMGKYSRIPILSDIADNITL